MTTRCRALPNLCPQRSQAADNFSLFLEREHEPEAVAGEDEASEFSTTAGDHNYKSPRPPAAITPGRGFAELEGGNSLASRQAEVGEREKGQVRQEDEERRRRRAQSPAAAEWTENVSAAAMGSGDVDVGIGNYGDSDGRNIIDDVTRPMPAHEAEPDSLRASAGGLEREGGGGSDVGRGLSGIFQLKKGPTLLEDRGD